LPIFFGLIGDAMEVNVFEKAEAQQVIHSTNIAEREAIAEA
jgi:hypothetical protein